MFLAWKLNDCARNAAEVVTLLLVFASGCSRTPSPKEVVNAYLSASNSHNVDSLLNCYNADAVFDFVGAGVPITGSGALRGLAEYDSVLNVMLALRVIRVHGDSVMLEGTESNDWLMAARLPPQRYSSVLFVVSKGKIRTVRAELSDSSVTRLNAVMSSLVPWAQDHYPREYVRLMSDGTFVYDAQNAGAILALLKKWQSVQVSSRSLK